MRDRRLWAAARGRPRSREPVLQPAEHPDHDQVDKTKTRSAAVTQFPAPTDADGPERGKYSLELLPGPLSQPDRDVRSRPLELGGHHLVGEFQQLAAGLDLKLHLSRGVSPR